MKEGAKASGEFQKILDYRGRAPLSPLIPMAQLQIARAHDVAGDKGKAKKGYQDFLAMWKDADADLPVLLQAKAEYAREQ
jgi:hypothetical protein